MAFLGCSNLTLSDSGLILPDPWVSFDRLGQPVLDASTSWDPFSLTPRSREWVFTFCIKLSFQISFCSLSSCSTLFLNYFLQITPPYFFFNPVCPLSLRSTSSSRKTPPSLPQSRSGLGDLPLQLRAPLNSPMRSFTMVCSDCMLTCLNALLTKRLGATRHICIIYPGAFRDPGAMLVKGNNNVIKM